VLQFGHWLSFGMECFSGISYPNRNFVVFFSVGVLLQISSTAERRLKKNCSSFSTCAPDRHLLRVTIPDAVLIQFDLLRMSKILLETCSCTS